MSFLIIGVAATELITVTKVSIEDFWRGLKLWGEQRMKSDV